MKISNKSLQGTDNETSFDLGVYTSGYEPRCTFLFQQKIKSEKTLVLGFRSFSDHPTRKLNDQLFLGGHCTIIEADGNNPLIIHQYFNNFLSEFSGKTLKIFVDYSSMTRVWYAEILSFFNTYESSTVLAVELLFGYSFAKYLPPPKENYRNLHVSPIDGFSYFSIPNKPSAVLVGLGYEKNKAFGLSEYFDGETYVFYNTDSADDRFNKDVESINHDIINSVGDDNVLLLPIYNLEFTERELYSLCDFLKSDYRVVITPTGPKPFTLISLIVSLKIGEIDVWRISQGDKRSTMQYEADGRVSYYGVSFTSSR